MNYNPFSFEQLEKLNLLNNQAFFLNGFTHMFNNPLNSIHMASELLKGYLQDINDFFYEPVLVGAGIKEECGAVIKTMPLLRGINDSTLKLNQLVSWFSELTGKGSTAGMYGVDINWLISHAVAMAHHQITACTKNFSLELSQELATVPGNAQQMLQVILNLLMNALLSLPDPSCGVSISTSFDHATGSYLIYVQDEGSGITPEEFPKIMAPFFSTWAKHGSIGLGLTVSNQIIQNHGGKLVIDSVPGKGTCALVSLPLFAST